jgi:hypothetical protein
VLDNKKVHMKRLVDELVNQIASMGFQSEKYSGDRPDGTKHYMVYTANWQWDMAMYLTYFRATLYEDGKVLEEVEYDAKMGGGNMKKFGKTADKIRPLLLELLARVDKGNTRPKLGTE